MTPIAYFHEALEAFTIMENEQTYAHMTGVKIVIKASIEGSIFVPWQDKDCFHEMIIIKKKKPTEKTEKLKVEVT